LGARRGLLSPNPSIRRSMPKSIYSMYGQQAVSP
jgi:hypothetical protein